MNGDFRSTTPTAPPPESPEAVQVQPSPPTSAQPPAEDDPEVHAEPEEPERKMNTNPPESRLPRPANTRTPEPPTLRPARIDTDRRNGLAHPHTPAAISIQAAHLLPERSSTPGTPASLPAFDWDDLESRFEKALGQANQDEQELMADFESLIKYFNIWASTAAAHDNDRATKRLQTRTHFVKLKEGDLASKKQNYEQVVQAFQSAMLLLSQAQN